MIDHQRPAERVKGSYDISTCRFLIVLRPKSLPHLNFSDSSIIPAVPYILYLDDPPVFFEPGLFTDFL